MVMCLIINDFSNSLEGNIAQFGNLFASPVVVIIVLAVNINLLHVMASVFKYFLQ